MKQKIVDTVFDNWCDKEFNSEILAAMDNNEIRRPGKDYAVRVNRFLDGLLAILKSWEEKEPCLIYPYLYILHVDLTENKKTALVSLQRTHGYEFIFKDIAIPFE